MTTVNLLPKKDRIVLAKYDTSSRCFSCNHFKIITEDGVLNLRYNPTHVEDMLTIIDNLQKTLKDFKEGVIDSGNIAMNSNIEYLEKQIRNTENSKEQRNSARKALRKLKSRQKKLNQKYNG